MNDYRSDVECLRAENARLLDRVAQMEATMKTEKVPMKWVVARVGDGLWAVAATYTFLYALAVITMAFAIVGHWVQTGSIPPVTAPGVRLAVVMVVLALAWCIAFVRRVPR